MADDINKKITIDVEVNSDGQQQIAQYKTALDNLRNTIDNLGKPISDLSDNINSLDQNLSKIGGSSDQVTSKVNTLSSTFSTSIGIIKTLTEQVEGWGLALSGGLSVLVAFAPEIIKWIGNMVKGTTTLSAFNRILQDSKTIMTTMNQVLAKGRLDSQQDYANITLLYETAKKGNLSMSLRLKAVKDLQEQYPAYFGKLSAEIILAGKAKNTYDLLTEAIKKSNQAKELKNKLAQNGDDRVKLEEQTNSEKDNLKALTEQRTAIEAELQKFKSLNPNFHANSDSNNPVQKQANDIYARLNGINDKIKNSTTTIQGFNHQYAVLIQSSKLIVDTYENIQKNAGKPIEMLNQSNEQLSKAGASKPKVKTSNSTSTQRDTTTLGPASSVGIPQTDAQPTGTIPVYNIPGVQADAQKVVAINKTTLQQIEDAAKQSAGKVATDALNTLQNSIKQQADAKVAALESQKNVELSNTNLTGSQKLIIQAKFKKQEDQVKAKAFKEEQELNIAKTLMSAALAAIQLWADPGFPTAIAQTVVLGAETAVQIAQIASQKPPAYATGGLHYTSDGKGGMLPGYSRTDNTNAYLRSGEGIVVSEAMRDPWARNLVSAINVGFGGRDFSTTTTGRGFAVGGIFTDGGDANRYYNAPVNDQKNLANSIAYQMVNNFPPVYVDVKDINNQQNILAQTINRVNL